MKTEATLSLKKLAIQGTLWTLAGYGASQMLRFGSNLILTRLLEPKLFGLMALLSVFIIGLHLFSDIGIGPSIIQNKRGDDPAFLNTAWTLQVIRGFCLWFGCLLLAAPVADFYGEPQLKLLLPVVGLGTIISGFASTALFTLNRHMLVGQLAIFELGGQIVAIAVMIVWARFSPSIWALVAGGLASDVVRMVWSHRLNSGPPNRFTWDRKAAKELFSFGRWIFISTAVTFLGTQTDRLILGKLISFEMLGIYGIALALASIPSQVIGAIGNKVIFPAVSKLADLPRETFRAKILHNRRLVLVGSAFILTLLVSFGDILILTLYPKKYDQAAWMLPILALGIWFNVLSETLRPSLLAIGKPSYQAGAQFVRSIYMCAGLPAGFYLGKVLGAVIVVALNELVLYGVILYGLLRERLAGVKQDILATALLFILLAAVLMSRFMLGLGSPLSMLLAGL